MKKIFIVFLCLLYCFGLKAQTDTTLIKTIAKQVQKEYAPDKRSIYFNVRIKDDSVLVESTSEKALQEFNKRTKELPGLKGTTQLLPSTLLNGYEYGLANLSVCNNRAFPQNSAEMMTQMILGTPVQVLKKQAGYYLVRTPDGYISWTDGAAVSLMDKQGFEHWKSAKRIIYIADFGHAFSKPNLGSDRVSDLVKGNILVLGGEEKGFYKVVFPDQRLGYIKKQEAMVLSDWEKRANPAADAILATAKTLIGVPYLWGGTSIKGVDCSGFTKTSYFLNGIIIPRDASQQALIGKEIDVLENDTISVAKCLKNLLPGDLMFFSAAKRRGISGGRVTHTAIYMGNGIFIQAAGMVRVNSIVPSAANYDEHQTLTLVGARRLLTEIGQPEITRVDQHEWYGTRL
ncbi:SH3 domain-containing C40 family peptidase [Pedobacter nototheniae]|uniref:SH3 domain-containing C40 family peptidase n=1 Tax=Pedobacter nototheniae TaxID=2488994 RepID=UPI00292CC506|nr:SH3 domain-containing C40 family peptidase [Pedobacter nototheniae]